MSVTDDFFKNPNRYLDDLDIEGANALIAQINPHIPSCLEALKNLPQAQASIDLLERKILELSHEAEAEPLLSAFGAWKKLAQDSVITYLFNHSSSYLSEAGAQELGYLLKVITHVDSLALLDEGAIDQAEVARTIDLAKSRLESLGGEVKGTLSPTFEKCEQLYLRFQSPVTVVDGESETISEATPVSLAEITFEASTQAELLERICTNIEAGELAKAYWPIQQRLFRLDDLKGLIEPEVYEWMALQQSFDPEHTSLEAMALSCDEGGVKGLGWGYKSANLTILSNQAQLISERCKAARVAVPSFMPISDFEMQRYIMRHYPEMGADWSAFVESFSAQERSSFEAGSLTLHEKSKEILAHIRKQIASVFEEHGYDTPFLREWLAKQKPEFVIVRSTGKEDSDTNSNAGGNASIPFVEPHPVAIAAAMSEVLISYFGEKSILQRMAAGDSSLFEKELFLPVLVQEMVGEPVQRSAADLSEIPSSGVIFTMSGADPTVTELSVGIGNNEGIVSSSVITDHYLLSSDGFVTKAVREKGTRVSAQASEGGGFECHTVENTDPLLRRAPALSEEVARDLKTMADYFSREVYGKEEPKPLDMEFTTLTTAGSDRPTIFLLQARPLIKVKKEKEPCYLSLDSLKSLDPSHLARGKTLIDGGAYVRSTTTSAMLVCDTITEALTRFLKSPPAIQSQIKTVVIARTAPITSHEAVTLRARGIGIIVVDESSDYEKVRQLHKEGRSLSIDMQRGVIACGLDEEAVKSGYTCYPIALEYSITPSVELTMLGRLADIEEAKKTRVAQIVKDHLKQLDKDIDSLIDRYKGGQGFESLMGESETQSWRNALEKMAFGESAEVKLAAAFILDRLKKLTTSSKLQALPKTRLELFIVLEEVKKIVEGPLVGAQDKAPGLERLYPVRLIEACLFQKGDVLGGFSALRSLRSIQDEKEIMAVTGGSLSDAVNAERSLMKAPLVRLSRSLLSARTQVAWNRIIEASTVLSPDLLDKVNQGIMKLARLQILTQWSNTRLETLLCSCGVMSAHAETSGSRDFLDISDEKILALFQAIENEFKLAEDEFKSCLKADEKAHVLTLQMGAWSDPEQVRKQSRQLVASFQEEGFTLDSKDESSLATRYSRATPLGKMAILQSTLRLVRSYDHLIKTVKSSTEYKSSIQQARDVERLLSQYYVMMEAVLAMAQSQSLFTKAPGLADSVEQSSLSIEQYLDSIRYGYREDLKEAMSPETRKVSPGFLHLFGPGTTQEEAAQLILPSSQFNVSSATLGSDSDYSFSTTWPKTLEDHFTLFHQNMEASISALRSTQAIPLKSLPLALQSQTELLLQKLSRSSITSINVEGGVVQMVINVPLRQHAGTLTMSYDLSKPEELRTLKMKMSLFGKDENSRWELLAGALGVVGDDLPTVKARAPEISYGEATGLTFEIEVLSRGHRELRATAEFLAGLNSLTMSASEPLEYLSDALGYKADLAASGTCIVDAKMLSRGGFMLALELANQKILGNQFGEARAIIEALKVYLLEQPAFKTLEVSKGFFKGSRQTQLEASLIELEAKLEGFSSGELKLSPWQAFVFEARRDRKATGHLLRVASSEQKADKSFVKEAVLDDPYNMMVAAVTLKRDRDFILDLMRTLPSVYCDAAPALKADPELALLYAQSNPPDPFKHIPSALQAREDIVMALMESNGLNLKNIQEPYRSRADIRAKAVASNGEALSLIPLSERSEGLCALALSKTRNVYAYLPMAMKEDREIAKTCVSEYIDQAKSLPDKLKLDISFVLSVMENLDRDQMAIFYKALPLATRQNPEVAKVAVSAEGLLLQEIEKDKITLELALAAARQTVQAHKFIPEIFWDNEELARLLVAKEGRLFFGCSDRLRSMPELAALALAQDPSIFPKLDPAFQKDPALISIAWGKVV